MPVPTTIAAYDAFILYPAHRYDIKGKRILKQEKKYYAVDLGMGSARVFAHFGLRPSPWR